MLGNALAVGGIFLTFLSVSFAGYQLFLSRRDHQARFLFDVNSWLFADDEIRRFYYVLDYGRWTFDPDTFRGSDDERILDKFLYTLDTIQRLIESNHIRPRELTFLHVEAAQVLNNPEVQKYFAWIRTEFPDRKPEELSFAAAQRMAKTLPDYR